MESLFLVVVLRCSKPGSTAATRARRKRKTPTLGKPVDGGYCDECDE